MVKKQKVIVVLPAYNAEKTLSSLVKKIPKDYYDEIILIDDASLDKTTEEAKKLGISFFENPFNLGYGGNLKVCLLKAIERGADVIAEIHPDGEYDPAALTAALKKIEEGADFVLGNRFTTFSSALLSGMPLWKYIPSRLLSLMHKYILSIPVSDMHQGFRVYTRELLNKIPFATNSNNYLFSFEIIAQANFHNMKILEVSVACNYKGAKRGASLKNSIKYTLGTFKVSLLYFLSKAGLKHHLFNGKKNGLVCTVCEEKGFVKEKYRVRDFMTEEQFKIFFCCYCENGFSYPVPKSLIKYYPNKYFVGNRLLEALREYIYLFFQKRRAQSVLSIQKNGSILDVGAGEGHIGKIFTKKGFSYQGLDASFAKLKNTQIIKQDFLKYNPKQTYSAITFWESLEHVPQPRKYLRKSNELLKDNGILFIEMPLFDSFESRIFKSKWYHLTPPRHLSHFTKKGFKKLLLMEGYITLSKKVALAPEYTLWGLTQSVLNIFQSQDKATAILIEKGNLHSKILYTICFILLLPATFTFMLTEYLFSSSAISLYIAKKRVNN